ncbi:MAG: type VI secretion system baseplate subunit TssE [Proteobacteria bacterium]|nr:type VI secretion system baseplate subunit TssE [Pseudomonadota bacterium]
MSFPLRLKQGVPAPLFDRLTDETPNVPMETVPFRVLDIDQLRASVVKEITTLLNTRCPVSEDWINQAERSVRDYGISDMAHYSTNSVEDSRRLSQMIARTIAAFEPRLSKIAVTVERIEHEFRRLAVQVDGLLRFGDIYEPVSFPVAIDRFEGLGDGE